MITAKTAQENVNKYTETRKNKELELKKALKEKNKSEILSFVEKSIKATSSQGKTEIAILDELKWNQEVLDILREAGFTVSYEGQRRSLYIYKISWN